MGESSEEFFLVDLLQLVMWNTSFFARSRALSRTGLGETTITATLG